ncbi:arsenate reductase (azurin) small subunit [Devosia naphthalenivorans]|uniref:arsenate reductase (azurin) small subunit n=1 Tax=Devosia naphthalenivorans TaxID=2082392 RepID=UPI000D39EEA6|nr:arsenate reductase (azurin) small subunit [Devosia naphthalenivorans]
MKSCDKLVDAGRRRFLSGSAVAAGAVAVSVLPAQAQQAGTALARVEYPSNRLGNVSELVVDEPLYVAYPDDDAPGVILKLGTRVEGGVGPDGDIVGFTTLCPHKGYPLFYKDTDRTLACPGHYSIFDVEKGGQQTWGHATQNLPQYVLRIEADGEIYADGLDELLFGRMSNVLA